MVQICTTLVDWAVAEVRKGRIIASMNEQEMKYKELVMPILQAAAKAAAAKRTEAGIKG